MASKISSQLSRTNSLNIDHNQKHTVTPPRSGSNSASHSRSNSNSQNQWSTLSKRSATVVITGQSQNCAVCNTAVYPAEQCLVDSVSLHPNCFRCRHCNQFLSLSSNEKMDGYFYCKAHYKLYSNGSELIRSNPLLANASHSQTISLAIEAQEAVGKTITGKKAAYESLVKASTTTILEQAFDNGNNSYKDSLGLTQSLKRASKLERSHSFLNIKNISNAAKESFNNLRNNNTNANVSNQFPVSKIVQNCLNIYETRNATLTSQANADRVGTLSAAKRSFSSGPSKSGYSGSISIPKLDKPVLLSRSKTTIVKNSYDPSLTAAQRTTLQTRLSNFQGQNQLLNANNEATTATTTTVAINLSPISTDTTTKVQIKPLKQVTNKFQSVIEKFSIIDEKDNSIKLDKKVINNESTKITQDKYNNIQPSSTIKLKSSTNKPSKVIVKGSFSYKNISDDPDLKEILSQVNKLSPPIFVKEAIEEAVNSLGQKLKDKEDYIEKLYSQIAILETKLNTLVS